MKPGPITPFKGTRISSAAALAVILGLLASAPAASAATVVAGPLAPSTNYLMPKVTISAGEPLSLQNYDLVSHDITSEAMFQPPRPKKRKGHKRPKRPPPELLFRSDLIGFGQSAPVTGTERLERGVSYPFFCSLHPSMQGTLTVR